MDNEKIEKGHWFRVITFFLSIWSVLSTFNFYKVISKLLNYYQSHNIDFELIQLPWLIVSLLPTLFFSIVCIVLPVVLAFLLHKRRNYKLCKILSVLVFLGFPWGTVLGIFSFVLLRRESIKSEFSAKLVYPKEAAANK